MTSRRTEDSVAHLDYFSGPGGGCPVGSRQTPGHAEGCRRRTGRVLSTRLSAGAFGHVVLLVGI